MAHKKNKKVNIFFIIIMLVVIGYLYYKFDPTASTQNKDDIKEVINAKTFPDNLFIDKISLNLKPKWFKEIDAEYPVGDVVGVKDLEKFVRNKADQLLCQNDEENLTQIQVDKKSDPSSYECSLEIKYSYTNSQNLLTHKLSEYGSYGGAHGIYNTETFTYDINGNKLELSDMAINKESYKKDIALKLKDGFKEYEKNNVDSNFDSVIDDVTAENNIDLLPFESQKDGFVFLFGETSGLSAGAGVVEIKIPFNELQSIIKPEFLY